MRKLGRMTTPNGGNLISATLKRARQGSLLGTARELRRELMFPKIINGVRGVYKSFAEANKAVPAAGKQGYDTEQHASMYDYRIDQLFIHDYAVLFWLSQAQAQLKTVFDLGGHTGVLYYGMKDRLKLPDTVRWLVQDVPTTVARGREMASSRGCPALQFTTEWEDGDGCDVLLASGVLQYLDWDIAERLGTWKRQPRHIIVNNTPLYDGADYITLQNTGISYNPYRVFNRAGLVSALERHGYVLRDSWRTERSLEVPLHPERRVDSYQGFVMEKA